MEVVRGLHNLRARHRGCVVTIGNFDGVHTGHQAVLREARAQAAALGRGTMLVCFEPQPKEFFNAFAAPARLTRFREKVELLAEQGLDYVLCLKFNEATRSMPAEDFIALLADDLQAGALYVGDDFRFGKNQEGGFADLEAAGRARGFPVTNLYTLAHQGERISSTRIRACLAAGDLRAAGQLLGRPYWISGKVVYGRQLGRTLDVPTANIQLHRYVAPLSGVFAVEALLGAGARPPVFQGVANVGVRPTVEAEGVKPLLEVHLFGFDGDLYGQRVKVVFRHKLREERKFPSIEALRGAITQDLADARAWFAAQGRQQP